MKYLFNYWDKLREHIKGKDIFLFLDYDGTLTSIVDDPDKAVLSEEIRGLLRRLSRKPSCRLAIISGRALQNIKKMVNISGIIYAGNHGLEAEGLGLIFKNPLIKCSKPVIKQIKTELVKNLSTVQGVFVEDKGLTLSVHYRLIEKGRSFELRKIFKDTLNPYYLKNEIKIRRGKKVLEVRPPIEWDKGKIVLWLLERQKSLFRRNTSPSQLSLTHTNAVEPIYLGDDYTDEDAFKSLKGRGVTVFVGKQRISQADYYLKDTNQVFRFLTEMEAVLKLKEV